MLDRILTKLDGRIVTAVLMVAIFSTAVAIAMIYFPPGARMLPLVVGIPGLLLSALQLVAELRKTDSKSVSDEIRKGEIVMVLWFGAFAGVILLLGFLYGSPLLIAAYLHFASKEKWYTTLIGGLIAWLVLEFVFIRGIGIVIYEGYLPPMLAGY